MKLREFLKVARNTHYRIYLPNRDCLIFESFFKVHSPFFFDDKHEEEFKANLDYYDNNDFCDNAAHLLNRDPAYDEETKIFLEKYGDMEVFAVEISSFRPTRIFKKDGVITTESKDEVKECLDIFITFFDATKTWGCRGCHLSLINANGECVPDPKDAGCKHCWRYREDTVKEKNS